MKDFLICFLILTTITVLTFCGCLAIANKQCSSTAEILEVEHSYSFWTSCMVKINNKWQPMNEYNTINLIK